MSALHTVAVAAYDVVAALPVDAPNPGPRTPANLAGPASDIIGYVKWGVIIVIAIAGLVGVGMIAGGKIFGHHGAGQKGIQVLVGAVIGAALVGVIIPFLNTVVA